MPGRPEVGPYLHGIAEDLPQTTIAWRAEMECVPDDANAAKSINAIFTKHRIRPHETATIPSYQLVEFLKGCAKQRNELNATRVALMFSRQLRVTTIGELIANPGPLNAQPTLILPESVRCIDDNGMLSLDADPQRRLDVADERGYEPDRNLLPRIRVIIRRTDEGWNAEPFLAETESISIPEGHFATSTKLVNELRGDQYRVRLVQPIRYDSDNEVLESLVLLAPWRRREQRDEEQTLDDHVAEVRIAAARIAEKLNLAEPFRSALLSAAKWHDEGKKARIWQRFIGNSNPDCQPYLGKSAEWCDPKKLSGYRHEFGSLLRLEHNQSELHPPECG